jgi:adenylate cyclase, class 2
MDESTETEVKIRIDALAGAREKLGRLGAVLVRERHFEENVLFDDEGGSLRESGTLLRLRQTPHAGVLTFKGPREIEDGVKSREERETAVDAPEQVRAILRNLGYRPVFRYEKYRESWAYRGQEIELDETPIGCFLEIEGDAPGIAAVAAELGYSPADYVAESYVGLFVAGGGKGDMVFPK